MHIQNTPSGGKVKNRFTPAEEAVIKRIYPDEGAPGVQKHLPTRRADSIQRVARRLGLNCALGRKITSVKNPMKNSYTGFRGEDAPLMKMAVCGRWR